MTAEVSSLGERRARSGPEILASIEHRQRYLPREMVAGCFEGSVDDGYQGPDPELVLQFLAMPGDWFEALQRLTALSAVAVHRIAQHDERTPLEVLDELWPAGGR